MDGSVNREFEEAAPVDASVDREFGDAAPMDASVDREFEGAAPDRPEAELALKWIDELSEIDEKTPAA